MSTITPEPLDRITAELIRRGLPPAYALRAAAELEDHRRDLVEELQAAGRSEAQARAEALQRLGDARTLMADTVREYQRRYWCGRWPLVTFFLAPIPVLIATWYAAGLSMWLVVGFLTKVGLTWTSDPNAAFTALPVEIKYVFLIGITLLIPVGVVVVFARIAKRAAMPWRWVVLSACLLGLFAGALKWERIGPGSRITMYDRQTMRPLEQPPTPDFVIVLAIPMHSLAWSEIKHCWLSSPVQVCQLSLPAAAAALLLVRGRQLAVSSQRLLADRC